MKVHFSVKTAVSMILAVMLVFSLGWTPVLAEEAVAEEAVTEEAVPETEGDPGTESVPEAEAADPETEAVLEAEAVDSETEAVPETEVVPEAEITPEEEESGSLLACQAVVQASKSSEDPAYVGGATTLERGPANPRTPKTYILDLNEGEYPLARNGVGAVLNYADYMQGVGILYPGDKLRIIPQDDPNPGRSGDHGLPGKVLRDAEGHWLDLQTGDTLGPLQVTDAVLLGKEVPHYYVREITVTGGPVILNYSGSGNGFASSWAVYNHRTNDAEANYWSGSTMVYVELPKYHPLSISYKDSTPYYSSDWTEFADEQMMFDGENPSVIWAEDLSCDYNPIDGWLTCGAEFTIYHPQVKGYVYCGSNVVWGSNNNFEAKRIFEAEDGNSSQWRFYYDGALDYNWSLPCKKVGSEEDPIEIQICYHEAKTIFLNANGGTVDDRNEELLVHQYRESRQSGTWRRTGLDLTAHVPVREGYVFEGWFADAACTKPVIEAGLSSTETTKALNIYLESQGLFIKDDGENCSENLDLYAGWADASRIDVSTAEISGLTGGTYSGEEITQTPVVTVDGKTLTAGTDYEVLYKNNVNAGTAELYIRGIGNYRGMAKTTFKIAPKPVTPIITLSETTHVYDGSYFVPEYTVSFEDGLELVKGTDYYVREYGTGGASTGSIRVEMFGNYSGSARAEFTVTPMPVEDFDAALKMTEFTYDGTEKTPSVSYVKVGDESLYYYEYSISYKNNTEAGTATAVITLNRNYTGSKEVPFTIAAQSKKWTVTVDQESYDHTYSNAYPSKYPAYTVTLDGKTVDPANYQASFVDNNRAGTAKVQAAGINEYAGYFGSDSFEILPLDISTSEVTEIGDQQWTGSPITPNVWIKLPGAYWEMCPNYYPDDFDIVYTNNINGGTATVTVTGKRNFEGSITLNFQIVGEGERIDLSGAAVSSIAAQTYSGKAKKPAVTVTFDGKELIKGTDYTVSYKNNTNAGTAKVIITGIGLYTGSKTVTFKIKVKKITPTVTLSKTKFTYTGKAIKPSVTVKYGSVTLKSGTDYSVKYASGRKKVGAYKVTVTLKGNYSGSKAVSFSIIPKGTAVKSLTAGTKKITVKWTAQKTQTSGYEIQASLKKGFTSIASKKTVSGASKTSGTITGLKTGKKYYVRIRTYKTVSGTKYYSGWKVYSKTVKVK